MNRKGIRIMDVGLEGTAKSWVALEDRERNWLV